jgi:hypothetical protein
MSRRVIVIGLVVAAVAAGGWAFFMNKSPLTPPPAADGAAAAAPDGVVTEVDRTVDWGAAAAKAGVTGKTVVSAQSVGVDIQSPVPMLALPNISAQAVDSGKQIVKATGDGYFATFPGAKYDVVVTGTKKAYKAPETAPPPTVSTQSVDEFAYSQTDTGAEVTFKQFGADYLVQFECKRPDETKPCITEAEARGVVESLVMVGN